MKISVTGASGGLGHSVCHALVADGHSVQGFDLSRRPEPGPVPITILDCRDRTAAYAVADSAEIIVHLANWPHPGQPDDQQLFTDNVSINMNVFQAAAECGVGKIVFSSSIQAVRRFPRPDQAAKSGVAYLPLDSNLPPDPENAYGLSKVVGEETLRYFTRNYPLHGIAVRFPMLASPRWREAVLKGRRKRTVYEAMTYLSMDDAGALIAAIVAADLPGFRIYLPGTHTPYKERSIPQLLAEEYAGIPLRRPVGEIEHLVDNRVITAETGWTPTDRGLTG